MLDVFAIVYQKRYTFAVSYYTDIYERAVDNYGLITSAQAQANGIPRIELVKLAERGRLERIGYGVYRIIPYTPTVLDKYAEAVALAGEGAYIFGMSVLAMLDLAFVNPTVITVATPKQVRRTLPEYISIIRRKCDNVTAYDGIAAQSVYDAIITCFGRVMPERLQDAVADSNSQGYITKREAEQLRSELEAK
jgi:predicted transcriptional regulator of viral defense system